MEKKKEKKKSDLRFVSIILPTIISSLVCLFLITLIVLEPLLIDPCKRLWFSSFDVSNIVVSLLPAIVTIISISLQIHDDSVFDVKIRKYQSIRTCIHFDLLQMVLISIAGFILQMISTILYRPFTSVVLAGVAGAYSLWFAISELPILMKNERTIIRILRGFLVKNAKNLQFENEVFDDAIKNYISTRGIKEAFYNLRSRSISDDALLFQLLNKQNDYLSACSEAVSCYKNNPYMAGNCADLTTILPNIYNNISDLCNLNDEFNYSIYDKEGQSVYLLARLCYLTKKLSKTASFSEETTIDRFKRILLHYHWRSDKTKTPPFINNFIITMVDWNLIEKKGSLWFFKALRDNDYPSFHFDFANDQLIFLSVMLSCFVFNSIHVGSDRKEQIDSFMNEETQGLNSDGTPLRKKIVSSIDAIFSDGRDNSVLNSLKAVLEIGMSLREHAFDIYPGGMKMVTVDDSVEFSVDLLVKYWFEILLFHEYAAFDVEETYRYLNELPNRHKEVLKRVIEDRLLIDDHKMNNSMKTPFFDFVYGGSMHKTEEPNVSLVKALIKFKDNFNESKYDVEHRPIGIETIKAIKAKEDELIGECISSFNTERKIDKKLFEEYSKNIRLEGENDELIELLGVSLKGLSNEINYIISKGIACKVDRIQRDSYSYTESQVNKILELGPELSNDIWGLELSCNEEQLKKRALLNIENAEYLPRFSFAKRGAVNFKVEYNNLTSMPRKATDAEINQIIDKEYIPINGLYSFSRYKGSKSGSFLVTREELFERIRDRIVFVPIVIRVAVEVDKKRILVFKNK